MSRRRVAITIAVVLALFVAGATFVLLTVNTDTRITIGAGLPGSSSHATAELMATDLQEAGFDVTIVDTTATLALIDDLKDPDNPINVTFLATEVPVHEYPAVQTLGTVSRAPIVFATIDGRSDITSLAQAKGLVIDVGSPKSTTEYFATRVLAQYGVTPENSTFTHLPAALTRADVAAADAQLIVTRVDGNRSNMRELIADGTLKPLQVREAKALEGPIKAAQAVTIPRGDFQINPPVPAEPVQTIGLLATVVADESLSPAADYAIARELTSEFSYGTSLNAPGEFPNFTDRQFPINAYAAEYYQTGQIPWQYTHLPPVLADSFVSLIVLASVILFLASIYSLLLPEIYSLWTGVLQPRSEGRYINAMEAALARGDELTVRQRQRLAQILERQDSGRVLRQRADALRPELSEQIDDETESDDDSVS